jgi:hypothetical protein
MRVGAVLLALVQLGVWGFYAPAHRLMYHSPLRSSTTVESVANCHSHCCGHHHHHHHSSAPADSGGTPDQCPDDEHQCPLCVLAVQAAQRSDAIALTGAVETVRAVSPFVLLMVMSECATPFDSRGPPAA